MKNFRSISTLIVLFCHVLWFGFFAMQNKAHIFRLYEELVYQWVINSQLLVDLFFVNSGFLMSYNYFKNKKQMAEIRTESVGANVKRFGRMVLQRYLR
jgi:peptidoglycan/LPS O-acetylase OafA/YrhL